MRGADRGIAHDRGRVLKEIADVAVLIARWADSTVVELVFVIEISVPLVAIVLPRNVLFEKRVADVAHGRRRNRERCVVNEGVGGSVCAIAEVTGIVIVQQVVVAGFAIRIDFARKRLEEAHDRTDAVLRGIRAVGIGAAARYRRAESTCAVAIFGVPVISGGGRVWIFDFIDGACIGSTGEDYLIFRRRRGIASAIAVPDGFARAHHDVIRTGAAVHGLMIVV